MNRRPSESRADVRPTGSITVEEPAPSPFAAVSLMLVFLVAVLGLWASVYLLPGT